MKRLIYFFLFLPVISTNAQETHVPGSERVNLDFAYQYNMVYGDMRSSLGPIQGAAFNVNAKPIKKFPVYFGIDGSASMFKPYSNYISFNTDSGLVEAKQMFISRMWTIALYGRINLNDSKSRMLFYADAKAGRVKTKTEMTITTTEGTETQTVVTADPIYEDCQVVGETYTETTTEVPNVITHKRETLITSSSMFGYIGVGVKIRIFNFLLGEEFQGMFFNLSGGMYFGNYITYATGFHQPEETAHCEEKGDPIMVPFYNVKTGVEHEHAVGYYYSQPFKMWQLKAGFTFAF